MADSCWFLADSSLLTSVCAKRKNTGPPATVLQRTHVYLCLRKENQQFFSKAQTTKKTITVPKQPPPNFFAL